MDGIIMKIQYSLALLLVSLFALQGCAATAASPVSGFLYSDIQAPFSGEGDAAGSLVGEATCVSYLGIVAVGDCSIQTARTAGGISTIHFIDYQTTNILGLYATFTV